MNKLEQAALEQPAKPSQDINKRESATCNPHPKEPFGYVTVRRLSQRFENHADQYQFYLAGQSPYLDNVDECYTVYTHPMQQLTDEQIAIIVDKHTYDDQGYEIWTDGKGVARAIEAAHGIGKQK